MRESHLQSLAERFSMAVLAREGLQEAVRVLAAVSVEVMPLKGVLLQALVYADVVDRALKDVDVAVRSVDFDRAYSALLRAGFQVVREEPSLYELALRVPTLPVCIDLHRGFSASRRFRLSPDDMFRRGRRDDALLGCPVVLPDDYDLYSHLLAHAVLDFVGGQGWHRPEDLGLVARVRALDPVTCARRLEEHGLARFARLAFAQGAVLGRDPFAQEVLANLGPDPLGSAIAGLARRVYRGAAPSAVRRLMGVLLNPSLGEAALALGEAMIKRSRGPIGLVRH